MNMAVKSIVKHPNLYGNLYEYKTDRDLALLKLSNDLEFNDAIQPISLPSTNYSNYDEFSSEVMFAGYGFEEIDKEEAKKINFYGDTLNHNYIKERTKKVNNMKKIEVYLDYLGYGLDDESILFSSTLGLWYGDSGGPLMKISSNSTNHVVIGIARGARFCSSGIANIYTRIAKYVPWIQKNLGKFDEENIGHDLDSEKLRLMISIMPLFPTLAALALADALFLKNWAHKIFYVTYVITKLLLQVVKKLFESSEIIAALVIVTTVIRAFVKLYIV